LLTTDGNPNLSFLRAKGLSEGITFIISGIYSRDVISDFISKTKEAIAIFYKQHFKPIKVEFTISEQDLIK
jgi:hypothetical protein